VLRCFVCGELASVSDLSICRPANDEMIERCPGSMNQTDMDADVSPVGVRVQRPRIECVVTHKFMSSPLQIILAVHTSLSRFPIIDLPVENLRKQREKLATNTSLSSRES
jgi:hypothetical protein